jgi:hypothetical protein
MTDFEQTLRITMHGAVDAEEARPGQLIRQVRRRHRRHTVLVLSAALVAVALAVPAAAAVYGAVTRSAPPATHKTTPRPNSFPSKLRGLPLPAGTNLQVLAPTGGWYSTRTQQTVPITGLPAPGPAIAQFAFAPVDGGWAVSSTADTSTCQQGECAGPPQEFYFVADGSTRATPVGLGYQVASASRRGALWLVKYQRPSDDIITTSASAQLVSTAGHPLGPRYRLPAGYLVYSGVGRYLLLSGTDGANVLWDPRTGRTLRRFAQVITAGPEQIVWTQGCGTCLLQILNVKTGGSTTTRFPGSSPAQLKASFSADGALLAALLKGGALGVLDTATGAMTVIPGTAVRDPMTLTFGWLGESHRLMVTATSGSHVAIQFGYWQPGDTRLWVATGTTADAEELPYSLP